MTQIRVELGEQSYPILVEPGALEMAAQHLQGFAANSRLFVLTDDHVGAHLLPRLQHAFAGSAIDLVVKSLPAGEASKSWRQLERVDLPQP